MISTITIPESEITIEASRSSGPGGQNVNKVSSKIRVRWNVHASHMFDSFQKSRIIQKCGHRMTKEGDIFVEVDDERSQTQNKKIALQRLQDIITTALKPVKARRQTRPTLASRERRLSTKKQIGMKKQSRSGAISLEE